MNRNNISSGKRSLEDLIYNNYAVLIKWTGCLQEDYYKLSHDYYTCGKDLLQYVNSNKRQPDITDNCFLSAVYLMRHAIELVIKAIICQVYSKHEIQEIFEDHQHDVYNLWLLCNREKVNYITDSEMLWLINYLRSMEEIDNKSDTFRFPFSDAFLDRYKNKSLDIVLMTKSSTQAYNLLKKHWLKGQSTSFEFKKKYKANFIIESKSGLNNCYLFQSFFDKGFEAKTTGYIQAAKHLFYKRNIPKEKLFFPIIFILRNTLELCLKNALSMELSFWNGKKKGNGNGHLLKKELWKKVKPLLSHYAELNKYDLTFIDKYERFIYKIDRLDKNGDMFRYPTSYNLAPRMNNKIYDLKNIYLYFKELITFLCGCNTMLEVAYDYENQAY